MGSDQQEMRPATSRPRARRITAILVAVAASGVVLSACSAGPGDASSTSTTGSSSSTTGSPASTTGVPTSTTSTAGTGACVTPPSAWTSTRVANELLMVLGQFTSTGSLAPEAKSGIGGFVFLGDPSSATGPSLHSALTQLAADAAEAGGVTPWMSTDTEGGPVSRLANVLGPIPSARDMTAQWSPSEVESQMEQRGVALRNLGITMDLAPVLDTAEPTDAVADESQRSFSATPQVVSSYGEAFFAGLRAGGVVAVGKHFPGLGHASADTDTGPASDPSITQLRNVDIVPFAHVVAAGLPVVMVGHPVVPGLTNGLPASLSPATYSLLRQTLYFGGVTMTDSLGAGAISAAGYDEASAAVAAVRAGVDMPMIYAATWPSVVQALVAAISDGTLSRSQVDASATRILAAKGVAVCGG